MAVQYYNHVYTCVYPWHCSSPWYIQAKLVFECDALDAIAELATEKQTGARGLRSIVVAERRQGTHTMPSMLPV